MHRDKSKPKKKDPFLNKIFFEKKLGEGSF